MVLLRWLSSWFLISKRNIQVHQKDTLDLSIHSSCLKALNDGRCLRLNQDLSREFKVKLPPMHINLTSCGCFQWKPRILVAMILCTLKVPLVTVAINCAFVLFAYIAMRSILVKILASESVACLAGVRKGTGSEFGRDVPEIPSPSLPLQTPPTQATESIFSVSSGSTMNWHQLERFPFELEMITDEKNTNKLTTIQEFDWVNLPHRRFRTW